MLKSSHFGIEFPAASRSDDYLDRMVCQGHADYCEEFGHATYKINDVEQGFCPRCGEATDVRN